MSSVSRFAYGSKELDSTPSRQEGVGPELENLFRHQAGHAVIGIGKKLNLPISTICLGMVYMNRFYMKHSFLKVNKYMLSSASLFLASKIDCNHSTLTVSVERLVKTASHLLWGTKVDVRDKEYVAMREEVMLLENLLLQTFGFCVEVELPHPYLISILNTIHAPTELKKEAYEVATKSLATSLWSYPPRAVACVVLNIACITNGFSIEGVQTKDDWFVYVDHTMTKEILKMLTYEYFECCHLPVIFPVPERPFKIQRSP